MNISLINIWTCITNINKRDDKVANIYNQSMNRDKIFTNGPSKKKMNSLPKTRIESFKRLYGSD